MYYRVIAIFIGFRTYPGMWKQKILKETDWKGYKCLKDVSHYPRYSCVGEAPFEDLFVRACRLQKQRCYEATNKSGLHTWRSVILLKNSVNKI